MEIKSPQLSQQSILYPVYIRSMNMSMKFMTDPETAWETDESLSERPLLVFFILSLSILVG